MSDRERKESEGKPGGGTPGNASGEAEGSEIDPDEAEVAAEEGVPEEEGSEETDPVLALEAEVEKWRELALRSQADLDNFRKRTARDRQDALRYANTGLLESLLPIMDNFEMGLEAARVESEESMIYQGMKMVLNQIHGFLDEQGVTEVEAEGQVFDPKAHEAVAQEASETVPEGEIVRVVRRGYRLRDRLLRAPAVVVSKGVSSEEEGEAEVADEA